MKRRLTVILNALHRADVNKRLARLHEYAKHRQVDRLIETMVAYREFLTEEHDAPVRALVRDIHAAATRGKKHPELGKLPEFKSFAWQPGISPFQRQTIVDRVAPPAARGLIASERIEGRGNFSECVALCNGDVIGFERDGALSFGAHESIVIATGSVRLTNCEACVIVCPGNVEVGGGGQVSVVVTAGGIVSYGNVGDVRWFKDGGIPREQDAAFFRAWKLYSASEAGAELWSAFGVVGVRAVAPDSPTARAGVKPGDLLTAIDGTPIRSVREANRLLCRATVTSGTTQLTIIRGRNRHESLVPLYEW